MPPRVPASGSAHLPAPAPPAIDPAVLIEQLAQLQATIDLLQQQNAALQVQLAAQAAPAPPAPAPVPVATAPPTNIKVTKPDVYDGSADCTEQFLHQCRLYFLSADDLTDLQRVTFTLSYMSKGRALSWAERKLEEVAAPGTEVVWGTFVALLHEAFGDSNRAVMACLKIKEVKQGKGTADDFVMRFEEYESFTGFDETALVDLFKDGLSPHILSCIYGLATMPTTLHEWKEKAQQFHHQYLELQQHQKAGSSLPGQHQAPPQTSSGSQGAHQTTPTSAPVKQEPRDGAVHQSSGTCTCYMCGSPDHFACECLQHQAASHGQHGGQ
jgi:hypothetical protein